MSQLLRHAADHRRSLDPLAVPESVFTNLVTIESNETAPTTVEKTTDVCPVIPVAFDIKPSAVRRSSGKMSSSSSNGALH